MNGAVCSTQSVNIQVVHVHMCMYMHIRTCTCAYVHVHRSSDRRAYPLRRPVRSVAVRCTTGSKARLLRRYSTFEVVQLYTPLLYSCNSYSPLGTDSIGYSCSRYTQITEQTAQTHHNVLSVSLNKLSLRLIGAMHRVHNAMRRNLDCEQHL